MKKLCSLLFVSLLVVSGSTAQMVSRLIGDEEHYFYPGPYGGFGNDSTGYTYTGNNGGDLTHTLKYTSLTYTSVLYNYYQGTIYYDYTDTQIFDKNDNIIATLTYQSSMFSRLYYYDSYNRDTSTIYGFVESNLWVNNYKEIFGYDADSNMILDENLNWNDTTNSWEPDNETIDTFDARNNLIVSDYFNWNKTSGTWQPSSRTIDSFDVHNNIIFNQQEGATGNNWDTAGYTRSFYNYNANGKDSLETDIQYYSNSVIEDTTYQTDIVYNSNNYPVMKKVYNWVKNEGWFPLDSDAYQYDDSNNLIYYLSTENQNYYYWEPIYLDVYKYNRFNQVTYSSVNTPILANYDTNYYYYQTINTGINQLSANTNQLSIYPNPSSDFIYVSLTQQQNQPVQISLYNMLGQEVYNAQTNLNPTAIIPVSGLPNGIYVLRMNEGGALLQKEVIVAK